MSCNKHNFPDLTCPTCMGNDKPSLAAMLHAIFKANKLEWKKADQTTFQPSENDFAQALDKVKTVLYDEPDGTQMEFGRLIVKKSEGHYDVYCHLGEIE